MWHELARWCGAERGHGFIDDWTLARADRAAEWTEQYVDGGVVSPAQVVGNRLIESIIADRERRLQEMLRRDLMVIGAARVA